MEHEPEDQAQTAAPITSKSPKDMYRDQIADEYDPYDHEAMANDLG